MAEPEMSLNQIKLDSKEAANKLTTKEIGGEDPSPPLLEESQRERKFRYAKQILIILGTAVGFQNEGMAVSWPNTFASDVQTDKSTLFNTTIDVTDWQLDLMSSSLYIGSLPTIIFAGWLVPVVGRRRAMMISAVPITISWAFVALAPDIPYVLTGRFLVGVGYGIQGIAIRPYLVEIPDVSIRGASGVAPEFMKGIGGIAIVSLGMAMSWYYLAVFGFFHALIFGMVIIPFLPESPTYLAVKDKTHEATKVLRSLRGPHVDVSKSIKELKEQNEVDDGGAGWGVFLKPSIMKKCFILFGLCMIANFSGTEVIRGNATRMLQSSGLALDKDLSTIIVFVILLGGNIAQILILDKIGRRRCLVVSLALLVFSYTVLGTYIHLTTSQIDFVQTEGNSTLVTDDLISPAPHNYWEWVPTACLMIAAFAISLGIGPIPFLLATEYFPTNIRPKALAICTIVANLMSISALQLFSPLQRAFTPAGLFWCYACFSGLGIVYTLLFIQETKGINVG